MGYRCAKCRKVKNHGDDCFLVKIIEGDGRIHQVPTCSEKCAEGLRDYHIRTYELRIDILKNQEIKLIKW